MFITAEYLISHPDHVFVFGDNTIHQGMGGAAMLCNFPNTYGFITKKFPNNNDRSFYRPDEYAPIFLQEMVELIVFIHSNPTKTFLISKLGAGLANKYGIYETVIQPNLQLLFTFPNVILLD